MAVKTKGLGKGLGTLLGDMAVLDQNRGVVPSEEAPVIQADRMVKIRMVEPNRDQPRKTFDEESLNELADSIRQYGVISPLIVTKKGEHYEIVAGERRWRAAKLAGLKEVPIIEREFTDEEIAEISLIENIQRRDLNPIEEAMAYDRLINEYALTQEELSEHLSKSRTTIANALRLLKLPEKVREMLISGELSSGHAKVILGLSSAEKQIEAAEKVAADKLSVRETEALVRSFSEKKAPKKDTKQALSNALQYDQLANLLKEKLGTRVKISRKSENAGKIEIDYYSLEDIERIIAHIR